MATNIKRYLQNHFALPVVVTNPTTPASGDPVRYGELTGIALTTEGEGGNAATETTVEFGACIVSVSVKGVDGAGNSAVAAGDAIYYVDADTPKLSKKATGYFFGFAHAAVNTGATATIEVMHAPAGSFIGTVNTSDIATGAVTAAKLSSTLKTGYIPIKLTDWREISADATMNIAANGGVLASDTTPIFQRVNGATDKAARLNWAATNVDQIIADFAYPPDLDDTADVVIHLFAGMAGATDAPTITVSYFEGVGDANAGSATAALSGTAGDKTVTIAAANIGVYPNFASIGLTLGAHGTDAAYLYSSHIEYTRK